jgi:hypothetical protein
MGSSDVAKVETQDAKLDCTSQTRNRNQESYNFAASECELEIGQIFALNVIIYPNAESPEKMGDRGGRHAQQLSGADCDAAFGSVVRNSWRDIFARSTHCAHNSCTLKNGGIPDPAELPPYLSAQDEPTFHN